MALLALAAGDPPERVVRKRALHVAPKWVGAAQAATSGGVDRATIDGARRTSVHGKSPDHVEHDADLGPTTLDGFPVKEVDVRTVRGQSLKSCAPAVTSHCDTAAVPPMPIAVKVIVGIRGSSLIAAVAGSARTSNRASFHVTLTDRADPA